MKKNSVLLYVAVAYACSRAIFIPLALNHHEVINLFTEKKVALGPTIGGLITFRYLLGKQSLKIFLGMYSFQELTTSPFVKEEISLQVESQA